MSDEKQKGDLLDAEAVNFDEDGEPIFEGTLTQQAETDGIPDKAVVTCVDY